MTARFFRSSSAFRSWLSRNHTSRTELWVGFHKKSSGLGGMTYEEAVDEALCFGWIDGIIRRLDAASYMHRFTPRRPGSIWSRVNVGHVARLTQAGLMQPAGLAAFAARDPRKTGTYAFESKRPVRFPPAALRRFRADAAAWKFFQAQAPYYQRLVIHRFFSGKRPETRERWLQRVIAASAAGQRL